MNEQHDRLRAAREAAGYATAREAAEAIGVKEVTYNHHENGTNKLSRSGARYAKFFRVRFDWLMNGEGPMRATPPLAADALKIAVPGHVGAGATVDWADDAQIDDDYRVDLPNPAECVGMIVRGDSQYPRFLNGEIVLVSRRAYTPTELLGQYAIVQTDDGRRLIKIIRRSANGADRFRLESHNAPPEEDVRVEFAWRYLGSLPQAAAFRLIAPRARRAR